MKPNVKIFDNPEKLAAGFAEEFADVINEYTLNKKKINIALSGGNTPKLFFNSLAADYKNKIDWNYVYIYWADERCVPPDDNESNYKMTKENLLDKITINSKNINRIRGEANSSEEAKRYSDLVKAQLNNVNGLPQFEIILLGMGADGHTASIFPGQTELFETDLVYAESVNPASSQRRITVTGKVINNSGRVYFIVSGRDKSAVLKKIIGNQNGADNFPASLVKPSQGRLLWYIDKNAAALL